MQSIYIKALVCTIFLFCAVVSIDIASANEYRITVIAEGTGSTKMEALKSAWQNAVRQAVGMYMTSKTEMLNDNLTEELAAYSRGQVNSYKTLSESYNNGIWTIKIQANIDRDIMQETLKASKSQSIQIDGGNLAAQIQSQQNKNQDAKEVIRIGDILNFKDALDYQLSLQSYNNGETIFARHILKFDLKKFQAWANTLEKFVAQMAIKKDEIKIKADWSKRALALINTSDYPIKPNPGMLEEDSRIITKGCYVVCPNAANVYPKWVENVLPKAMQGYMGFRCEKFGGKEEKYTITFLKNQSVAARYFLSEEAYNDIHTMCSRYQLTFYVEAGEGYDAISEPNKRELSFSFPFNNSRDGIFIAPTFGVSVIKSGGLECPVLFVFQKLDIPVDKIAKLKNITGRYTLEPIQKSY